MAIPDWSSIDHRVSGGETAGLQKNVQTQEDMADREVEGARLTGEEIRQLLDYRPETGEFFWRPRAAIDPKLKGWDTKYAGKPAGTKRADGYIGLKVGRRHYQAHRLAWLHYYGQWPTGDVDHINGVIDDNRIPNLRDCTHSQNLCNRGKQSNNTSGFKGVHWSNENKNWRAAIWVNRKQRYLGSFPTRELAAAAYEAAANRYHGEFAKI